MLWKLFLDNWLNSFYESLVRRLTILKNEKFIRLGKFAVLHINFVSLTEEQIYSLSNPTLVLVKLDIAYQIFTNRNAW